MLVCGFLPVVQDPTCFTIPLKAIREPFLITPGPQKPPPLVCLGFYFSLEHCKGRDPPNPPKARQTNNLVFFPSRRKHNSKVTTSGPIKRPERHTIYCRPIAKEEGSTEERKEDRRRAHLNTFDATISSRVITPTTTNTFFRRDFAENKRKTVRIQINRNTNVF